jgi:hypothetical protein
MAASLGQVGRIVMQMDARLSDTVRKSPILGIDGAPGVVTFDPNQQTAFARAEDGVHVNPGVGSYGVRVVVGASYSTQRSQTNAAFAEIMRGNPDMAPVVAPFWAQTLDFPGADKFAQALAAMAPEPVKAILQPEGQDNAPDPAQLSQALKQCQDALQEAIKLGQEAQQDADEAMAGKEEAERLSEAKERELEIKAYEAETKRLQVLGASQEQAEQLVRGLIAQMLDHPDPLPGDPPMQQDQPEAEEIPDQPEMAEVPTMEAQPMPQEQPPEPDPQIAQILDGQRVMAEMLGQLQSAMAKPRKRVPVRDKAGNIVSVIDSIVDEVQE